MSKSFFQIIVFSLLIISCSKKSNNTYEITSPNGKNKIAFILKNGIPLYSVSHSDKIILTPSSLGFVFKNKDSLNTNFEIINVNKEAFDETWKPIWGETQFIRNNYTQISINLKEKSHAKRDLKIQFRAFDDGIAFRYIYPQQGKDSLIIMDELTTFNLQEDGYAWWIPAYKGNRYEYLTTKSLVSTLDTVHTPLTIKSNSGLSLSFHEANLKDFASMTLAHQKGTSLKCDLVPWADGDKVKTNGSFTTPWRTIQIADVPSDLITSNLILNLNDPNVIEDTSWIKPHKYLGIWWGMHIGKYSFWESPIQGATTKHAKEYIDYCKKLGIDHLLIEGWNKGWTPAWYENAMHMFSFTEEANNFNLKEVTDYAKANGVSIIGYHETGSNIINYLKQIDAGMKLYQKNGIHDVKIGQVGSRLNMKEWHHGQFGVNYYRQVLKTAAKYKLTVNFHEPIKDTGERRTYPNMMAREGARGQEYNAWSEGNPPNHTAILPFTRMLAGPMDFTPGILDVEIKQGYEGKDVHTTAAKQLALYVVYFSPIQMLADLPENYDENPAFKFLQDVPVDWNDTKVLNAEIGEYITTVRKDKNSDDWYLGSLTNEKGRTFEIDLSFLDNNATYEAQIYQDFKGITWNKGANKITISTKKVLATDKLQLNLAPGGGTAVRFKKIE
ncbi:glycoside hydrolase family 97 protein [Lutibacter sp. B1]|uniref:glycoside hydrolase family 97 protein n=1 Tax=Lutibacter sp. B1 TaxID=2725996 RepID=UPI00145746F1|nr:glycoside hydrolase family 97 protein [Lutibacter sp. B1]NLP56896.1 glycoside hydrolase family 97 protein [Lutibacter sp. B1]